MDSVLIIIIMENPISEIIIKIKGKAKDVIIISKEINLMENSRKEKLKALGNFITQMVIDILDIINMILKMAMGLIIIKMEKDMWENSKKE